MSLSETEVYRFLSSLPLNEFVFLPAVCMRLLVAGEGIMAEIPFSWPKGSLFPCHHRDTLPPTNMAAHPGESLHTPLLKLLWIKLHLGGFLPPAAHLVPTTVAAIRAIAFSHQGALFPLNNMALQVLSEIYCCWALSPSLCCVSSFLPTWLPPDLIYLGQS